MYPSVAEVEKELTAQIERAVHSGLKIDYVDSHMGTATRYPEFQEVAERLARQYNLGMSEYFNETLLAPQYLAAPKDKSDSLLTMVGRLQGLSLVVTHVGIDNAELGALIDMNDEGALADMSKNRQGELDALDIADVQGTAQRLVASGLMTYRQLIEQRGLRDEQTSWMRSPSPTWK
ncbi:MAG: ChbG/HpnK family deacetylase [Gemmatimonadaceae bacterium]